VGLSRPPGPGPDQPLRVAVIGAGAMAREHIKAFRDVPGVAIAGIWNRTRAKAQLLAQQCGLPVVAGSIDDLYAQTRADLAIVAVYETAINPIMKQALVHPWAILMEKPVGLDVDDGEDIAAAAKSRQVYVGLNRRFLASTQAVLADLAGDPAPRFIHVQDQQSLETAKQIGHADIVVRNWMYANSIHLVDYFCALGRGDITEVTRVAPWQPEHPGVVLARIAFASGDSGLYEGIWNGPGPWACSVTTARRRWEMRPLEAAQYQNAGERTLNPVSPHAWDGDFKPGFRLQAQRVAGAVRGRGGNGAVRLDDAMRTMRLIGAIFAR
jgi:predicted dehydrogenase